MLERIERELVVRAIGVGRINDAEKKRHEKSLALPVEPI
jgi:hypothetical protein